MFSLLHIPLFSLNIGQIIVCSSMQPDHRGFYVFSVAEPHNESDIVDNFQSRLAIVILLSGGLFVCSAGMC